MPTSPCPKCQGTGTLSHFAHVDGGKCWACTDKADTSYTQASARSGDEALAEFHETNRRRSEARRQRREAIGGR